MAWYKRASFWAILAALPYAAWELGHWWLEPEIYTPWAFGQGFAVGSLIFGFWGLGTLLFSKASVAARGLASADPPAAQTPPSEPPLREVEEEEEAAIEQSRVRKAEERINYYSSA